MCIIERKIYKNFCHYKIYLVHMVFLIFNNENKISFITLHFIVLKGQMCIYFIYFKYHMENVK